jgi:shikimate dehydrogenase
VALLGDPIDHSLSPAFQNAAFEAAGLDAVYVALRCAEKELSGLLRGIALSGGAGNVTIPHKAAAARALDRHTEAVGATGVCNTFWSEHGIVWGDNTDVAGVSAAVESALGRSPRGARVLMLGAGGAARAAACALIQDGVGELVVLNRSAERARELRSAFAASAPITVAGNVDDLVTEAFDLAINATSLGLHDADPLPLPPHVRVRIGTALDLVYSPRQTRWVHHLRERGIPATDGQEMLLHQGAAAFVRWWGIDAPLDAMRAAMPRADRRVES